jgi:hypothetical protein
MSASTSSVGARALNLVLTQSAWTHRRVDSLAFLPNGESHRRISWDFTVPDQLVIVVGKDRMAVPLATMAKRSLKRLDVRDASDAALPLWNSQNNAELAQRMLVAGLESATGLPPDSGLRTRLRLLTLAANADSAARELEDLDTWLREHGSEPDQHALLGGLARTFADAFLFVVEVPRAWAGTRTTVKVSYDDDRARAPRPIWESVRALGVPELAGCSTLDIEAQGWADAASWHLEVHAPEGVRVRRLHVEVWSADTEDLRHEVDDGPDVATAHVAGQAIGRRDRAAAAASFSAARHGLLNHVTLGAVTALVLLMVATQAAEPLATRLSSRQGGTSLAAAALAAPAFLMALISRGPEHELVARVLFAPRTASFVSAILLAAAGVLMLWTPPFDVLSRGLLLITLAQGAVVAWLARIRAVPASG